MATDAWAVARLFDWYLTLSIALGELDRGEGHPEERIGGILDEMQHIIFVLTGKTPERLDDEFDRALDEHTEREVKPDGN